MLTELCQELRNWFDRERHYGTFTIEGGELTVPFLQTNQYYRIIGSVFNDGVHKYGDETDELTDETFEGAIWSMAIPQAVINLATEIAEWQEKYGAVDSSAMSPYQSESFGGYTYSKSAGGNASGASGASGWKAAFSHRLNMWRKI